MAQVDFYQLSRDPVERVVPLLAGKVIESGERLLVITADPVQRAALSDALWARERTLLANGAAGEPHAERQPILLSAQCEPVNGARTAILADGEWREDAAGFERTVLLFGAEQTDAARALWSALSGSGRALRIFKQDERGGWREGR